MRSLSDIYFLGGFGPVCENGLGIGYIVGKDWLGAFFHGFKVNEISNPTLKLQLTINQGLNLRKTINLGYYLDLKDYRILIFCVIKDSPNTEEFAETVLQYWLLMQKSIELESSK